MYVHAHTYSKLFREGVREGGSEGGREGVREGGSEGGREGVREGGRKGREGEREIAWSDR